MNSEINENNSEEISNYPFKINNEDNIFKEQNNNFSNNESDKIEKDIFTKAYIQKDNWKLLDIVNINNIISTGN